MGSFVESQYDFYEKRQEEVDRQQEVINRAMANLALSGQMSFDLPDIEDGTIVRFPIHRRFEDMA